MTRDDGAPGAPRIERPCRYALLEHDYPKRHWDLLVETRPASRIPTWRLSADARGATLPIAAVRLRDHRRRYLAFDGVLAGGRGTVRRVASGVVRRTGDTATAGFELLDGPLAGRWTVESVGAGDAVQLVRVE